MQPRAPQKKMPQPVTPKSAGKKNIKVNAKPSSSVTKPPQSDKGEVTVFHRNAFYREADKKLFLMALIAVAGLFMQSIVAYMAFTAKSERVYIATDQNGSIIKHQPLNKPNQKPEVVAQWVQKALVDSFSFNFTNFNTRLNESTMLWFTENGASEFIKELQQSGYLQVVKDGKMIMSMTMEHTPIMVQQGLSGRGVYTWTFQSDAILTFRTQSQEFSKKVRFTITAERISVLETEEGLGIAKLVMTNR